MGRDSDISENFTRLSPLRISRRLQPCGHFLCLQPTFLHFCNETCRRGYAKWKGQCRTNKQLNSFEVYEHFTCLNRFRLSKLRTSSKSPTTRTFFPKMKIENVVEQTIVDAIPWSHSSGRTSA